VKLQKNIVKNIGQDDSEDPYYDAIKTIYENISTGTDSVRKQDIVTKY
jgi:hypothetical protein